MASELHDQQNYEVEFDAKSYQVEVLLLEDTEKYLHVLLAVGDGSFRTFLLPLTQTFLCEKPSNEQVAG